MQQVIRCEKSKPCCKVVILSVCILILCYFCSLARAQADTEMVQQQVETAVQIQQQADEIHRMLILQQTADQEHWEVSPPPVDSLFREEYEEWRCGSEGK